MALLSGDGWLFLLRWFHFLAGITWIGMLYYFNFVQTPFFGSKFVADNAAVRSGIVRGGLLNNALWWFRWGAMITFITGWLYILHVAFARYGGIREFAATSYGWKIFFGGMLGTTMWANVWFVIWPGQQVVIAPPSRSRPAASESPWPPWWAPGRDWRRGPIPSLDPDALLHGRGLAPGHGQPAHHRSEMGCADPARGGDHRRRGQRAGRRGGPASGGKKLLATLKGTFWAGFILTLILYVLWPASSARRGHAGGKSRGPGARRRARHVLGGAISGSSQGGDIARQVGAGRHHAGGSLGLVARRVGRLAAPWSPAAPATSP